MKNNNYFRTLLGALMLGSVITACDKFEDDVPPARMTSMQLNNDNFTTLKNQSLQIDVLANDTIGGTATLTFGQPQNGTIQTTNNGGILYQPANNFTGTDSFSYTACLGNDCASAMVNIMVRNDTTNVCAVTAFDDIISLHEYSADTIEVLSNDNLCGIAATNNTITIIQPPMHGVTSVWSPDKIYYHSLRNYVGPDEMTYRITNSKGTSTAKIKFNITPNPQSCVIKANPDSTSLTRHLGAIDTVSMAVVANDIICPNNGPVNVNLLNGTSTQFGTLMLAYNGNQPRIIYMTNPNAPKGVMDTFQYRICQGNNCSSSSVMVFLR